MNSISSVESLCKIFTADDDSPVVSENILLLLNLNTSISETLTNSSIDEYSKLLRFLTLVLYQK